ncbi:TldD/PmbA family protein [Litorimonas sp. RW-G-Af-16]|uniref:TldD/PmbA family protein n=1 Tax=Litorimonas sp. RW-G-Af-16 TaxID=3241168 RepID=UPI00390C6DDF
MALADPITPQSLKPALDALLLAAKRAGATQADALASHGRSSAITVRDGKLEDIDNSEGRDIGLRVFVGQRQACVSSSDISPDSIEALADRAVAMAKLAPEDPYCGLADKSLWSAKRDAEGLELYDGTYLSPADLKDRALQVEAAAKSIKGVNQAEGASASASSSARFFMTSDGFAGGWQSSNYGVSVAAIAEQNGAMERDYDYDSRRWLSDLRTPEDVGRRAGERTIARLGAKQLPSGAMPIIFDERVANSLVGAMLGAISGPSIARGVSFLKDKLGEPVFAKHIQIIDDPSRLRGPASKPFDGEGMKVSKTAIIKDGILTTWLLNTSSAKQLGLAPTGHGGRGVSAPPGVSTSNTYLAAGTKTQADLIAEVGNGLLISEMFGPSLNSNTGDYSVGVAGFHIENGVMTHPVSEVTIAGNLLEIYKTMVPANDLIFDRSTVAPSLLCEGLTLAGS